MSPQLELKLNERGRRPTAPRGPLWRRVLYWSPAWLPFVLMVQVGVVGLAPAWAEKGRLDRAEADVDARETGLQTEYEALVEDRRKLSDPIYRERVRRSLLDLELEPLRLEDTRRDR